MSLPTSPLTVGADEFVKTTFDYLVIGGGNTGLPVAARLSENPSITVGLLEAGLFHKGDPLIDVPGKIRQSHGNPKYDWSFSTIPQVAANGRSERVPRGKMLGGTSSLNYMVWTRASKSEYDGWKNLSDEDGWTWDTLLPFFRKSESTAPYSMDPFPALSQSDQDVVRSGMLDPSGTSGPVKLSYNFEYSDIIPEYIRGWNALGIQTNANPLGGYTAGIYNTMTSVDRQTGTRCDAAKAYFWPVSNRKNLKVITGAQVTKVHFGDNRDSHGNLVATGVSFDVAGTRFLVNARKEIIVSAGAIQTPQILELSGIGNAKLLRSLSIDPLLDLPGVGENLHDHLFTRNQFLVKPGIRTFDEMRINPAYMARQTALYESSGTGCFAATPSAVGFLPLRACVDTPTFESKMHSLKESIENGQFTPLQKAQYKIQMDWLLKGDIPSIETALQPLGIVKPEPGKSYFTVIAGIQHPFSRGSVHINSTDPLASPVIDPRFLTHDIDLEILVSTCRLLEKFSETPPMQNIIDSVTFPPTPMATDAELQSYIRAECFSGFHQMGTCAMARRELGGVVDSHLKVHGTSNLRIADTSIIPIPIATHPQATAYAIGEKAADMIKKDMSHRSPHNTRQSQL